MLVDIDGGRTRQSIKRAYSTPFAVTCAGGPEVTECRKDGSNPSCASAACRAGPFNVGTCLPAVARPAAIQRVPRRVTTMCRPPCPAAPRPRLGAPRPPALPYPGPPPPPSKRTLALVLQEALEQGKRVRVAGHFQRERGLLRLQTSITTASHNRPHTCPSVGPLAAPRAS